LESPATVPAAATTTAIAPASRLAEWSHEPARRCSGGSSSCCSLWSAAHIAALHARDERSLPLPFGGGSWSATQLPCPEHPIRRWRTRQVPVPSPEAGEWFGIGFGKRWRGSEAHGSECEQQEQRHQQRGLLSVSGSRILFVSVS